MKNIKKIVKTRLDEIGKSAKWLAGQLEISETALQNIYRSNSTSLDTLEKLANILGIAQQDFFDSPNTMGAIELEKYGLSNKEVDLLLLKALKIVTEENERLKNNKTIPDEA